MNFSLIIIYFINGLVLVGLVYYGSQLIKNTCLKKYYYPALLFKGIATLSIGFLYTQYYQGGDITNFYNSGKLLSQLPFSDFICELTAPTAQTNSQRSIYFIKIVGVLIFITKSNFWFTCLYCSLITFFGSFYFITQVQKIYPTTLLPSVLSVFFLPSVVFWSSGIIKEAVVFGCFLFFIGYTIKLIHGISFKWIESWIAILAFLILILLKYYIVAALIPCLALYFLVHLRLNISGSKWFGIAIVLLLIVLFGLQFIHPNLNPNLFFHAMGVARNSLIENSKPEAIIHLYTGTNIIVSGGINFFILLFSSFFRPTLFESFQFPNILAGLENTLILFLFISRFFGKISLDKNGFLVLFTLLIYIIILALFLTYSTPNFGTLSRFKIYYLSFFLILVLSNHPLINWLKSSKIFKAIA